MKLKIVMALPILLTLVGCSAPVDVAPSSTALPIATTQVVLIASSTFSPVPALTQTPGSTQPATPQSVTSQPPVATSALAFCDDPRNRQLISSFSTAVTTSDGAMLASLVSPSKGMDVLFYRDGNVINYDVEHAKFVFETTYQADWGLSYGSGQPTIGAFKEIIVPSLKQVFTPNAEVVCNQLKVGGATYDPTWPYPNLNFYSVHFPGTEDYGGLDWQTWVVGIDNSSATPTIAALVHFVWEP